MNRAERRRQRKSAVSGHQRSAINEKTSEEILLNTAMQYLANGHTSRAKEVCSGILKNNPSQPDALHLIGLVALKTGNYKAKINLHSEIESEILIEVVNESDKEK